MAAQTKPFEHPVNSNASHPRGPRGFANAAPLGLSAFALTTLLLSLFNLNTRGVSKPNMAVSAAYAYGGLIQLLAGMWEMAAGNTLSATAFSSFGGFWLSVAIVFTPGGFQILESLGGEDQAFFDSFGLFFMCWFIFDSIIVLATLRTSVAFFLLFLSLDLTFLLLGIGYLVRVDGLPHTACVRAGGGFGVATAFLAWYNALAELLDHSNSFFLVPVAPFPWAAKTHENGDSPR